MGNDVLNGDADADVFVFGPVDAGADRIEAFELGTDGLELRGLGIYDEGVALAATQAVNGSAVISVGLVTIILAGVTEAQLQAAGDFLV